MVQRQVLTSCCTLFLLIRHCYPSCDTVSRMQILRYLLTRQLERVRASIPIQYSHTSSHILWSSALDRLEAVGRIRSAINHLTQGVTILGSTHTYAGVHIRAHRGASPTHPLLHMHSLTVSLPPWKLIEPYAYECMPFASS